ncbi:phosphatase PAP2 family protein [Streptomyces sp. NPDC088097]|uniref:phosphatase PAP2 family protein n=1 Tax=Streptomyces sp. NPDC088097 TaxID=3365823 RepID=UPI00382E8CDF
MTDRRRPTRWWAELLLLGLLYGAYSGGRLLARGDVDLAVGHGLALLRVEELLRIDFERPLNRLFSRSGVLGIPADFFYASLHYLITPAVLVWLYRRRPRHYRDARSGLVAATVLGLVGFALAPTCPPRLLEASYGFTDTMARYSAYGWWGGEASAPRGLGALTNQYAAMPSLHVGWALWCGILLWRHARHPLVRTLGAAYPVLTTLVVMGTANHYFLDAVAGAAVLGAGWVLGPRVATWAGARADRWEALPARFRRKSTIVSGGWDTSARELLPARRSPAGRTTDRAADRDADRADRGDRAADDTAAAAR